MGFDLSDPAQRLRTNWEAHVIPAADGTATLHPSFVAETGPRVWIVDVREGHELNGPAGHIPGTYRMPMARVAEVAAKLPPDAPVILVCDDGTRSTVAARFLRVMGMKMVASMNGGMIRWRAKGYRVSRGQAALTRFLEAPAPGTGSDGLPLVVPKGGERRLTREQIEAHLGDISKTRRVKLAALQLASRISCVDGREDRAIIGTPGGDAGELVLGLAAVERVSGTKIHLDRIPELTQVFADVFGSIYLHTDDHALDALAKSLRADPRTSSRTDDLQTVEDWDRFLRSPPSEIREALLEHLIQVDHVGCGHLKLALKNPEQYAVRPEIIHHLFRAIYASLWEGGSDVDWVILGGHHHEGAVVNVTVHGEMWPFSKVPLIHPSVGGVQMFVNHPEVLGYMRRQTSHFLSARVDNLLPLGKNDAPRLEVTIPELGGEQATATLLALANGLPTFGAHFERDGFVTVTEGDPIGA